jgi:ATP-dependent RNA helicase RhlE
MNSFNELGLAPPIMQALTREGHSSPTSIQSQAIPPVMAGRDLMGIAQTGTGKTAAFALPILHRLAATPDRHAMPKTCRVLVLTPTRELAQQVRERFDAYGAKLRLRTAVTVGGVAIGPQIRALAQGVDVLIATPGRLLDLMGSRAVRLDAVEVFVLDEADRMLDMGFIHPIRQIASKLPTDRQTLFFSATMPKPIADLGRAFLRDPVTVAVSPLAKTADRIDQGVVFVRPGGKLSELERLLVGNAVARALVFARTKRGADRIVRGLAKSGVAATAIHGDKTQPQRERALDGFRSGTTRVLIATDIAARGIDVPNITHVINYDLPSEPETYVHRIGRTARAGAGGIAITLCTPEEREQLDAIQKLIRQQIPVRAAGANGANARPPLPGHARTEARPPMPGRARTEARPASPGRTKPPRKRSRRGRRIDAMPEWLTA